MLTLNDNLTDLFLDLKRCAVSTIGIYKWSYFVIIIEFPYKQGVGINKYAQ